MTVACLREGANVVLRFADNGPGIPEALRGGLFEPGAAGMGLFAAPPPVWPAISDSFVTWVSRWRFSILAAALASAMPMRNPLTWAATSEL